MPGLLSVSSVLLLLVLLVTAPAAAGEAEPASAWLRLSAPAGCPDAASIEARVVELLGGPVPSPEAVDVRAVFTFASPEWEVDVTLNLGQARGTRRLRAASCADAADFVAITVVLALDPTHAPAQPEAREAEAPSVAAFPETPAPPPAASPQASPEAMAPRARLFVSFGAEGLVGALPSLRIGPTAAVGAQLGPWLFSLGGSYFPEVAEGADIAENPVALSLVHARARGCFLFGSGQLAGGPCLNADVGAMMADEVVSGGRRATELYVALGGGARGELRLASFASLVGQAGLSVPLTQPRFILSDGTLLHRPEVGAAASLELSLVWQ